MHIYIPKNSSTCVFSHTTLNILFLRACKFFVKGGIDHEQYLCKSGWKVEQHSWVDSNIPHL